VEIIQDVRFDLNGDVWTHDGIKNDGVIGRINDPVIFTTDRGREYRPASIIYHKVDDESNGNGKEWVRQNGDGRWARRLADYSKDMHSLIVQGRPQNLLVDPESGVFVAAVLYDENTTIYNAEEVVGRLSEYAPTWVEPFARITKAFPGVDVGIIGSMQVGLNGELSDIDAVIYGGDNFHRINQALRDEEFSREIGISFQDESRLSEHTSKYIKRYGVSEKVARDIALRRARFLIHTEDDKTIKLGINGNFRRGEHTGVTIFGSKLIGARSYIERIADHENSCSFPRQYVTESGLVIASNQWGHQLLAEQGDTVSVRGGLRRQKDGRDVLFLESEHTDLMIRRDV